MENEKKGYYDFVKQVKEKNPEMSYKDQQKVASEQYKEYKASLEVKEGNVNEAPAENEKKAPEKKSETVGMKANEHKLLQMARQAEKCILDNYKGNIHHINNEMLKVGFKRPQYKINKQGLEGVNTLLYVTIEGHENIRIPEDSTKFYRVFM